MRYIKPPDFKSVKEFEKHYQEVERKITALLTTDGSAKSAEELNSLLNATLSSAVSYLSKVNKTFTQKELPTAFKEGKDSVKEPVKVTAKEVTAILSRQGFRYANDAFSYDTYIELQTSLNQSVNHFKTRVNKTIEELRKQGKDSVYNVQQAIIEDFKKNGILTVEYSNGAKQPIEKYAPMVARSARIESINIGAIGRALQAGTDYVIMTEVPECCKLCGAYQGKVYCISGKDKRFPALFKTVLKNGYALPHPNCRHEFIPYFPEMEDPADVERMIKRSKIKYDKQGNLVDVRFQKDIEAYAEWQAGNRQLNTEYLEFQKMKAHYAGREEEMPYKTLAGFRRARRADDLSPAFKKWRYRKRDAKQYEEWKAILGVENMPEDVDKFQELKYNKDTQDTFLLLRHYKKSLKNGDIAALSNFSNYQKQYKSIKENICGKVFDGVTIKSVSYHFIDRTVGSIYYTYRNGKKIKHEGVSVEQSLKILQEGVARETVYDKKNRASKKYILKGLGDVTINPEMGELVQVNKDE